MRYAHVVAPRTSALVSVADAPPPPGHVAVAARVSGICASELPAWTGFAGDTPSRLGHELSGEVLLIVILS
ncbi:hypothetical protein SSBG_06287 [Streptomyces sp. SPB074]|nr:hypothetical protein SSBG_06287 [Streptomyces sp. SPB074]